MRAVERVVNGLGFTAIRERHERGRGLAVEPAGPGLRQCPPAARPHPQPRPSDASVGGLGRARSATSISSGPPLLFAETSGSTPFRLSTHVGDVGHMLIVGPTGAGKSVLLSLLALQFRRYPGRAGLSSSTRAGRRARPCSRWAAAHHELGGRMRRRAALAFQPLRRIDQAARAGLGAEWLCGAARRTRRSRSRPRSRTRSGRRY